ncbi:MAG: hypothetical protein EBS30_11865 [Planctomycetes bacterium]|nr:hypothetical protein [Planctomycetota bacterium]
MNTGYSRPLPDPTATLYAGEDTLQRMVNAVEKVRDRLKRSTNALEEAKVPYAVVGGNAVAAWVSEVDESAARNTQDVDILLRREDLEKATAALEKVGFIHKTGAGITMFLDGPGAKARDAVHVIFANEKVRPEYEFPSPDVASSVIKSNSMRVLALEDLVRMKLTSNRDKDRTHVRDLISVGILRPVLATTLPPGLSIRLLSILATPEG